MSNIIKSEFVFYDINNDKNQKKESSQIKIPRSSKEELYEIYNQREIIIKEANDEALRIINTAKRSAQSEISELKKKGYEEGYNAGFEIGKNKGYDEGYETASLKVAEEFINQNENKLKEINEMINEIETQKQIIISKYEEDIPKLSIDIAEKIIKQKIDFKGSTVTNIIESIIKDYRNVEWVKIYISEKDAVKQIEADKSLLSELMKISKEVKIEPMKDLKEGSLIIETPDNIVDASFDTQLKNLREIVLN